ncbi:uncharacterized, partial [Tachysurus ichikawai]
LQGHFLTHTKSDLKFDATALTSSAASVVMKRLIFCRVWVWRLATTTSRSCARGRSKRSAVPHQKVDKYTLPPWLGSHTPHSKETAHHIKLEPEALGEAWRSSSTSCTVRGWRFSGT